MLRGHQRVEHAGIVALPHVAGQGEVSFQRIARRELLREANGASIALRLK